MKLLFVVDSFRGGAGNVIQILACEFVRRRYEVNILLLNGKQVESKYDLHGINIIDFPLNEYAPGKSPIDRVYKAVKVIRRQFNELKPDVIISFLSELNILCCMANSKRVPIIVSERNDPAKYHLKLYWKLLRRIMYKKADCIVVQCSNFKSFSSGLFFDRCVVIPNPILEPPVSRSNNDFGRVIRFVSMGRLTKQKNFIWMIDRMIELRRKKKNYILSIYGSGELQSKLQNYVKQKKADEYIKFEGYAVDTYRVLVDCDVYLMTSDYEGFPNALSEAMAVGLPSVSRLCHEGIKDLVHNGINGLIVEKNDKDQFVREIIRLMDNLELRENISNEAKKVSKDYSVSHVVDMWEREIRNITFECV